jgi:carnitine 3-dehydrogenase
MGSFMTYHLAGGPGGMRDFIKQFDPTLELPWTDLKFPKWSDDAGKSWSRAARPQARASPSPRWEAKRDAVLVDLMKVFHRHGSAPALVLERSPNHAMQPHRETTMPHP